MKQLKKKLTETIGESIAEVLVASLIAGLGLLMLASMITASKNIITKSSTKMKNYYTAMSNIEAKTIESEEVETVKIEGNSLGASITVDVYKETNDGLTSYYKHKE